MRTFIYTYVPWVGIFCAISLILLSVLLLQDWALAVFGAAGLAGMLAFKRKAPALKARDERRYQGR